MDPTYNAKLCSLFEPEVKHPGLVIAATNTSGTKSLIEAYGNVSISGTESITKDAVFWIASMTKPFTAVAALQCVELGQFSLDSHEDVARLLPEMAQPDIFTDWNPETKAFKLGKAKRTFTLRELLSHQSGLYYDPFDERLVAWRASRGEGPQWLCGDVIKSHQIPLLNEPGDDFNYSGGYEWVGRMIERANGCRLGEYFDKHIFQPLGIRDITFDIETRPDLESRLVKMASRFSGDQPIVDGWLDMAKHARLKDHYGGGGLFGTAVDCVKFFAALLKNDGTLVSKDLLDETVFRSQLAPSGKAKLNTILAAAPAYVVPGVAKGITGDWGLGSLLIDEHWEGHASKGSLVSAGLANCYSIVDRQAGFCAVYLTQLLPIGDPETEELRTEWFAAMRTSVADN